MSGSHDGPLAPLALLVEWMLTDAQLLNRCLAKIARNSGTGCWVWQGRLNDHGYGRIRCRRDDVERAWRAHRVVWELVKQTRIPEGRELDHLCRNRACVNPDHLEVVTADENKRRGLSLPAINARKTHCNRGHAFTAENTTRVKRGRHCAACHREDVLKERNEIITRGLLLRRCRKCKKQRRVKADGPWLCRECSK